MEAGLVAARYQAFVGKRCCRQFGLADVNAITYRECWALIGSGGDVQLRTSRGC